jgi:hypothetical protein
VVVALDGTSGEDVIEGEPSVEEPHRLRVTSIQHVDEGADAGEMGRQSQHQLALAAGLAD